jgi:fibronectin-binding autotransporter adhesin
MMIMSKSTRINQRASRTSAHPIQTTTLALRKTWPISLCVGLVVGSIVFSSDALAGGPTGGTVVGGSGTITQTGNSTVINQVSNRLALNWQTFNVGVNESVLFNQPGRSAVALNRILDQNPSQIFGRINSNGQVFLINTHGIIFGATAQLNVGGLMASTLDLTPTDFLAGHYNLNLAAPSAGIVNHGLIQAASGGSVSLVGGSVLNDGLIFANYGKINLDGADHATLDFDGNGLINIQITGDLKQRLDAKEAAVTNKGTLKAEDGTVVLQASAAKDLFTNLVNNSGVIDASGISTDGGVVRLIGNGGNVESSGSINVSGVHGGTVQLLSDQNVGVTGGSINASGTLGGGSIRIGGGWQAGEGLQTAAATYVAPDATLNADATRSGNGGSVVVWGNQVNNFYGSISARGGALGGDGGRVETSSHYGLNAQGQVDASAVHGNAGTWLLDPYDVTITNAADSNVNVTGSGKIYTASGNTSNIKASGLGSALTGGTNVFVFTNNAANGTQNGDITLNNSITASGAGSLYLEAAGSIFLNSNITGASTANPLNVYLWANYGGTAAGTTYSSNATCASSTACAVVIGNTGNATINTRGGNVDIETTGAVQVGNGTHTGVINAGSGTLNIGTGNAVASVDEGSNGSITAATLTGLSGGAVNLTATNHIAALGNFTAAGFNLTDAQALAVIAGGTVDGGASTTLTTTTGGLTINGAVKGTTTTLTSAGAINEGAGGVITAGTLTGSSVNGTTLNGANLVGTLGSFSASNFALTNAQALTVSGPLTTTGGTGNIGLTTSSGVLSVNTVLSGSDVNLNSAGNLTLTNDIDGSTVELASGGSIAQSGGVLTAGTLSGSSVGSTALGDVNLVSSLGNFTAAGFSLTNGQALTVATGDTVNGGTSTSLTTTTGDLTINGTVKGTTTTLTSAGAINEGAGGVVNATTLTGSSTGDTTLNGANLVGTLGSFSAVNFALTNAQALAVSGPLTTTGNIGLTTTSGALNVTTALAGNAVNLTGASGITLNNNVTTSAGQTYTGAVTLGADATLASSGNGAIGFTSTVNGAHNLAVNTGGATTFGGVVGGTAALASLTTDAGGSTSLGGNVTTSGAQHYGDAVLLGSNATLATTNSAVTFDSTLDNATATQRSLTINAGSGAVTFTGAAGGGANGALLGLTTHSGTFSANALTIGSGGLSVTSTAGAISQGGAFTVAGASSFNAGANAITLGNLGNNFTGAVSLIGGNVSLVNNAATTLGTSTVGGTLDVGSNGALTQTGALTVTGAATFTQNNTTAGATQDILLGTQANDFKSGVTFASGAGAAINNLSLKNIDATPGTLTLPANVAGDLTLNYTNAALTVPVIGVGGTLDVTAGGGITINGNVTTGLGQTYNSAVTLGADATLASTGNGAIDFVSTVDGAHALTVNTGGLTTFDGAVGGTTALTNLITDAAGSTMLSGNVTTSGFQYYHDAVTLGGDAVLSSTGDFVEFDSTVDGAHALTVNTPSLGTAFLGNVGGTTALTSLTLGTGGITYLAGNVTTSGAQTYGNAVTLLGTSPQTLTGSAVDFVSTLDGAQALTVNASGVTTFGGAVGASQALTSLTTDAGGTTTLGGNVSTTGAQTYSDAVALGGDATLASSGGGAIDFGSTVNGAHNLAVNTGGATTFGGVVGGTAALASLTTDAGGNTTLSGDVTTSGTQHYGDAVLLGSNATLATTNSAVTFDNTLDNATATQQSLTVNAGSGAVTFTGAVGGGANGALLGLTTHSGTFSANALTINGPLSVTTTAGGITQGGAFTVAGTSSFNAGTNAITLANAGNAFGGVVSLTGGATQITNGSALTLGAVNTGALTAISTGALNLGSGTIAGNLQATSNNGAVSQSGALAVSGTSNINAGTGAITLANAGNAFGGVVSLTGGATQITNGSALTLGAVNTGALTVTSGDLVISGAVNSTSVTLNSSGAISEGGSGSLTTGILTGQSTGATNLNGTNLIGTLGSFSAAGFSLINGQALTVTGPVNGGASTALTTTAGDLAINGAVSGTLTTLNSAGAITEGAGVVITAGTLTGQSVGSTDLNGANLINTLGSFTSDFSLTNAQTLTVAGPLNGGPVVTLTTTAGDLIINGAVNGTTTTLNSAGAISEGAAGVITADTLSGQSAGATSLTGANHIGTLGSFNAAGFGLTNAQALAVTGPVNGGSSAALTTTAGDLAINGAVNGTTTTLKSAGAINEGAGGSLTATTLNGQSTGATSLNGTNHIGTLGSFSAAGFGLTNAQSLAVTGPVNGGASTALTTTAGDLAINGAVSGTTTTLKSAGAISEGASGSITASNLSGQSTGATSLNGANHIGTLGSFSAAGFGLTNAQTLAVTGPINGGSSAALTTTSGDLAINGAVNGTTTTLKSAGAINEGAGGSLTATTLNGQSTGATSLNGTNHVGTLGSFSASNFGLTNAQSLAVTGPVNGGASTTLTTTAGDLAINGAVSGNTTTLKSAGAISEGTSGVITAGTLSGQAVGTTTLGSAAQRNNNMVTTLGNFSSPAGFSMTNNKTLTLASVAGSAFTVNAGTSAFYLSVTNGDLFQLGTTPVYDGLGTWGSTGRMGTASAPIYVVGTGLQMIANVGLPPAYFYAIDSSGNLLPLGGGFAVNLPTASGAGGAQNGNHGDSYIDPSVITANYRSYGIVPSGVRLPADQQSGCDPDQPDQADCQDDNSVGMVGIMLNARR